ncbi:MAG TPA: MEDS domain-containing protein [Vicinamibacterales bacterium]|nr:MEDS domain-containing protein [Vicinamibacterales bacterium]
MTYAEHIVHGNVVSHHLVQLFDSQESRASEIAAYLREGWAAGDTLLALLSAAHWGATARLLREQQIDTGELVESGQLTLLDSTAMLSAIMRNGVLRTDLFEASVGATVRRLRHSRPGRLRVYGELVDLLAADGDFATAHRLEELWNDLLEREPLTLFCGYASECFGNPKASPALRLICDTHSHVRTSARDALGAFLVDRRGDSPAAPLRL